MKKKLLISIMLIILILTLLCVYFYKNNAIFLKNIFNNEKKIDISLCGETYNVIDINVNGKYITKDLINETLKLNNDWCDNPYSRNKDGLKVSYNNNIIPMYIFIGYKGIEYEYILNKNSIYFSDMYSGGLGKKVLDLERKY